MGQSVNPGGSRFVRASAKAPRREVWDWERTEGESGWALPVVSHARVCLLLYTRPLVLIYNPVEGATVLLLQSGQL